MTGLSQHQRRFHLEHLLVTLAVVVLTLALVLSASPSFLSRFIYDRMLNTLPAPQETDIVIIAIDEYSLRELGRWPWNRALHAELIDRLAQYGARAVFLDLLLAEPDLLRPESDQALAQSMRRHGNVYLPVHVEQLRSGGQLVEVLPYREFAEAAAALGHVDLELDSDGVVRRVYLRSGISQAWWPHISVAMLEHLQPGSMTAYTRMEPPRSGSFANIREYPRLIPFAGQAGSYPSLSAADVINGRVPPQLLHGQMVLVGATAAGLGDLLPTPMSDDGVLMPGVELNANIIDAIRQDRLITPLSKPVVVLVSVLLALMAPLLLPFVAPRWAVPLVAGLLVGILLAGYLLLRVFELWLPLGPALVSTALAYPLWTWRRLEYTLDYLKAALGRLSEYSDLNRRLSDPVALAPMIRLIEQTLPVQAWRLDFTREQREQVGGEPVPEAAWQSRRARHYPMVRGGQQVELSLLWLDEQPDAGLEAWVRAMANRASAGAVSGGAPYEVVENYIERVREEEVRQQALTRFFNASLAQMQDGVAICDACGDVLFANHRALSWLGLSPDQLGSIHFLDLARELVLPRENDDWARLVASTMGGDHVQFECATRDGAELYLEMIRVDAGSRPGQVLIMTLKDIAEVKQAMRERSELLDFLSHDLRSPMISLLALAEKMRNSPQGAGLGDFLDAVDHHARRNLNIAEQFLQLARVESLDTVELQPLDMLPVLESAMDDVGAQAQARGVTLRFDYNHDDDVWVNGNHELLQRLVVNLLTNAIKYSHPGGSVTVSLRAIGDQVACEVRDRGIGIPPEYMERLFERFSRASNSGGSRGAGLGLRFVRVVADRHGGDIRVQSQPGEGSSFTLLLPRIELDMESGPG